MGATTDKIKGKAMQLEGKLTGDKVRMAQGTAKKAKGDVEGAASRLAGKVKRGANRIKRDVKSALSKAKTRARR